MWQTSKCIWDLMVVFYRIAKKEILGNGNHVFFREIKVRKIGFIKLCDIHFPGMVSMCSTSETSVWYIKDPRLLDWHA